jgi:ribosomal protection tetracycline resistance protein
LQQGLYGWEIPDIAVAVTHTGYSSPTTVAADFRRLVPLVLLQAIAAAGTTVHEPVNHFELDIPPDSMARVLSLLAESRAVVEQTTLGTDIAHVEGTIPAATTHPFETHLPGQTHGEGILTTTSTTYTPAPPPTPVRPRTDGNPLNQPQYLLHLNQA